jgi:MerR family regulatory protein
MTPSAQELSRLPNLRLEWQSAAACPITLVTLKYGESVTDEKAANDKIVENDESVCYVELVRKEWIRMTTAAHEMVSAAGLAKYLGLAASTVRQYAREGRIPVALRTPGGHGRFIVEDAQAALANDKGKVKAPKMEPGNTPLERRTFTRVPVTGEGEVRVSAGKSQSISDDWQLRLAVGAIRVGPDDFGDLEPSPVIGVVDGARFVLDHDHVLAGV